MPFNMALITGGRRTFILNITVEDLASTYNIESEVISNYGITGTVAGDLILLNVAAVNVIAATTAGYALDGDSLHDDAQLRIILTSGALISGRGGRGGNGGHAAFLDESPPPEPATVGLPGGAGGAAIRYGCPTVITGPGTVSMGYGGGGGGGAGTTSPSLQHGSGGGGGGVPLGAGGSLGTGLSGSGTAGNAATTSTAGTGGSAGGAGGGAGGEGGDSGGASAAGGNGAATLGGAAGANGDAINTQTFSHTAEGGVTITGSVV